MRKSFAYCPLAYCPKKIYKYMAITCAGESLLYSTLLVQYSIVTVNLQ